MKKLILIAAAFALPGCAALPALSMASSLIPGISSAGDKVVMEGTRALVIAEYAYNSAATTVNAVGKACLEAPAVPCPISASDAGTIRKLNAQATMALVKGKAARDDATRAIAARDVLAIVATIDELRK